MLRWAAALASSTALKRALSAASRPSILARSISTAPFSSRFHNLRYQTPRIPISPSSPYYRLRGFANKTGKTTNDFDGDSSSMDDDDDLAEDDGDYFDSDEDLSDGVDSDEDD